MRPVKRILGNATVRRFLCWLTAQYIRLVRVTGRWRVEGPAPVAFWDSGRPFILAFWHQRLSMIPYIWRRGVAGSMLISRHRDGELIAETIRHFGFGAIRGSPGRGGVQAMREMVRRLESGECVGITPDGPRGPRMRASSGIIALARRSGVPIVPVTVTASRRRVLGSWDRFIIALPFSRGVVRWGEAILVARDAPGAALESARRELEERLNTLGADADGACGHAPLLPAPPAAEAVGPLPGAAEQTAPGTADEPATLVLYRGTTRVLAPLIGLYLRRRRSRGKEEPGRLGERLGRASLTRPDGELVWLHAASVGETVSVLTVIERVLAAHDRCHVLLTTGTRTSAALAAERLPARACHQFVPVDRPDAVRRFLKHWRPDLALWVESELWPNLITAARARGIPMVLLNARMSARSFARWRRVRKLAAAVIGCFDLCLAQSPAEAERYRTLGARVVRLAGNLKHAAAALPADEAELAQLRSATAGRPLWLAASTHEGEEAIVGTVHAILKARHPRLLSVVVPRHPGRGEGLGRDFARQGLEVARRGAGEAIDTTTDIYVADTLGELGLFYRLAGIVLVGGSLVARGGHNPLEPARLDCALLCGPHTENFAPMVAALAEAEAIRTVADAGALADAVAELLDDAPERARRAAAAQAIAAHGAGALDAIMAELAPWLPDSAPAPRDSRVHAGT